jgi:hypothetical protein
MMGELSAEGALNDGLLEPPNRRSKLFGRERSTN